MIGCLVLIILGVRYFQGYLTGRFMLRQTRQAIECRADPAVDLQNPDLYFVDIVPRINWGKRLKEKASDIGLLELNWARRQLIFEGDRERYWIPAESILEIKHEFWAEANPNQLTIPKASSPRRRSRDDALPAPGRRGSSAATYRFQPANRKASTR